MTSPLASLPTPEEEPPARRQVGARVEVILETPAGEEVYVVHVTNRERLHYEKTAAKHKEWPAPSQGQSFVMTFVTWSAAKRAERTTLTFEQWQEALLDWNDVSEERADPTR